MSKPTFNEKVDYWADQLESPSSNPDEDMQVSRADLVGAYSDFFVEGKTLRSGPIGLIPFQTGSLRELAGELMEVDPCMEYRHLSSLDSGEPAMRNFRSRLRGDLLSRGFPRRKIAGLSLATGMRYGRYQCALPIVHNINLPVVEFTTSLVVDPETTHLGTRLVCGHITRERTRLDSGECIQRVVLANETAEAATTTNPPKTIEVPAGYIAVLGFNSLHSAPAYPQPPIGESSNILPYRFLARGVFTFGT